MIRTIALTGEDNGIFASVGLNGALGLALDRAGNLYAAMMQQLPGAAPGESGP